MRPNSLVELVYLLHRAAPLTELLSFADLPLLYQASGLNSYSCQGEIAILALPDRPTLEPEFIVQILILAVRSIVSSTHRSHIDFLSVRLGQLLGRSELEMLSHGEAFAIRDTLIPDLRRLLGRWESEEPQERHAVTAREETAPIHAWIASVESIARGDSPPASKSGAQE